MDYIHGSTDAREVARLEKQAHFVWPIVRRLFVVRGDERILDLGTGVGAMAGRILQDHPSARLVGADLRYAQLRSAKANHPGVTYVNADGTQLPFADGAFDRIHCSWLLEHVREPVAILRECRRVLRPGGAAHFIEVDNATFRTEPPDEDLQWAMDALNAAQVQAGGDPFVGQKLEHYFQEAGFSFVQVQRSPLDGTAADLPGYRAFAEEFAEIFEGLDEALGPSNAARLQQVAQKLRALPDVPGSRMQYAGVIAVAYP